MKRTLLGLALALAAAALQPSPAAAGNDEIIAPHQLVVIEAEPGRARAVSMSPTWCALADDKTPWTGGRVSRYLKNVTERVWSPVVLGEAGAGLCRNPAEPSWQQQTGYFLQVWMNLTGLRQDEVVSSITQRVQVKRWTSLQQQTCREFTIGAETSELDKFELEAKAEVLACSGGWEAWMKRPRRDARDLWFLDRQITPSELVRVHHVFSCLPDPFSGDGASAPRALAAYALCGVEARLLSAKALEKELAAGKYNDYAKTVAREAHSRARLEAAEYARVVEALAVKDPAYRTILLDAPEAAWKAYAEEAGRLSGAMTAALTFDVQAFAPSQQATDGCLPALRAGFRAYLASGGIKTEAEAAARVASPFGAALLSRLMHCEAREDNFNTAAMLTDLYRRGRQAQGPRYAVYYAVASAVAEIKSDRSQFPLALDLLGQLDWGPYVNGTYNEAADAKRRVGNDTAGQSSHTSFMEDVKGTVKSVKPAGAQVLVTFKTEKWKEETFDCHDTKKIWRIESDGRLNYHRSCKSTGWQTVTKTERPILIPAEAAEGLKAGMLLSGRADYPFTAMKDQKRLGYPIAVYDSAKKQKLISWYGMKI